MSIAEFALKNQLKLRRDPPEIMTPLVTFGIPSSPYIW